MPGDAIDLVDHRFDPAANLVYVVRQAALRDTFDDTWRSLKRREDVALNRENMLPAFDYRDVRDLVRDL